MLNGMGAGTSERRGPRGPGRPGRQVGWPISRISFIGTYYCSINRLESILGQAETTESGASANDPCGDVAGDRMFANLWKMDV
jgi:hypothetical protein